MLLGQFSLRHTDKKSTRVLDEGSPIPRLWILARAGRVRRTIGDAQPGVESRYMLSPSMKDKHIDIPAAGLTLKRWDRRTKAGANHSFHSLAAKRFGSVCLCE